MVEFKIMIFKAGDKTPETVITLPSKVMRVASKLLPKRANRILEEEGIDITEIANLASSGNVKGKLIELEKKGERIVIFIS